MSTNELNDNDTWVKLVSSDGYSFLIKRSVAMMSGTLKNMLNFDSSFKEALANTCPISERAPVVEKVCEYMSFKAHYEGPGAKEDVPLNEFTERIPPEIALELLLAADYLEALPDLLGVHHPPFRDIVSRLLPLSLVNPVPSAGGGDIKFHFLSGECVTAWREAAK